MVHCPGRLALVWLRMDRSQAITSLTTGASEAHAMFYVVLIGIGAWAGVATLACLSVCMAAARFNHEAESAA